MANLQNVGDKNNLNCPPNAFLMKWLKKVILVMCVVITCQIDNYKEK